MISSKLSRAMLMFALTNFALRTWGIFEGSITYDGDAAASGYIEVDLRTGRLTKSKVREAIFLCCSFGSGEVVPAANCGM